MNALEKAVVAAKTAANLAALIGKSASLINVWRNGGGIVPALDCIAIESALDGHVTRYELRPDIFGINAKTPAPRLVPVSRPVFTPQEKG